MIIEMAPMEGITNYIYRSVFNKHFSGVDRYFTPFLSPNQHHSFQTKERNEIDPDLTDGLEVIPQLLGNNAEHFLWAAKECLDHGFTEINYNLGCPSGIVVSKHKGSGQLADPEALDALLDEIYSKVPVKLSIKTRLGMTDPEEFFKILEVYKKYPLSELIIHPRVRKEFYQGDVHDEIFQAVYEQSLPFPLTFNGNIFSLEDAQKVMEKYPGLFGLMLGRGMLADLSLARRLKGGDPMKKEEFIAFHNELVARNRQVLSGDSPLLHRMKELWPYWHVMFTNGYHYWKKVRKTTHFSVYEEAVNEMFEKEDLIEGAFFSTYLSD